MEESRHTMAFLVQPRMVFRFFQRNNLRKSRDIAGVFLSTHPAISVSDELRQRPVIPELVTGNRGWIASEHGAQYHCSMEKDLLSTVIYQKQLGH